MARGLKPQTISSDSALGSAVIERSLRFSNVDDPNLQRSVSTTSNRRTYTYSFWTKRGLPNAERQFIYNGHPSSTPYIDCRFNYDGTDGYDTFQFFSYSSQYDMRLVPRRAFRDVNSWYHFVIAVDTTQATESNRIKMYINGVQETDFYTPGGASAEIYPSQNFDTAANISGNIQNVGNFRDGTSQHYDGYLAEVHFVDGYQYDPSTFGFTDPQTGIWMPKRYEGTHGTNGFYLDFSDNSSASALGIDRSINGNDFTVSNLATTDSVIDTPTNIFCTWNPISTLNLPELREGNLKQMGTNNTACNGTIGVTSGKWYWEQYCLTDISSSSYISNSGVTKYETENDGDNEPRLNYTTGRSHYRGINSSGVYGYKNYNQSSASEINSGGTYWGGAVIGFRLDMDAGTLKYYTNNTLVHTDSSIPTDGTRIFPMNSNTNSGGSRYNSSVMNFGQDSSFAGNKTAQGNTDENGIGDFYYAVPSGFRALCTKNLPKPDTIITKPQRHFAPVLYTPFGGAGSVTGLEFKPDLIWVKSRNQGYSHYLWDSVRGTGQKALSSNLDSAEGHDATLISSFDEGGFTIPGTSGINDTGSGTNGVIAFCWKAGGAAVSNTDGDITSSVSVNEEAGFSIATYTGTYSSGSNAATTIGHGLGKVPKCAFFKKRSDTGNWMIYHEGLGNTHNLYLNTSDTPQDDAHAFFDTSPTSSLFTFGISGFLNASGQTYVGYFWAEIPGYSKFGTYTGNGNANGTYVHLGFRPALIIFKSTSASENWQMKDNKRAGYNDQNHSFFCNAANTEYTTAEMDFLSKGFKLRNGGGGSNGSGETFVYMAWAEQPGITSFDTFPNAR